MMNLLQGVLKSEQQSQSQRLGLIQKKIINLKVKVKRVMDQDENKTSFQDNPSLLINKINVVNNIINRFVIFYL
jgi:hypothetical protein